MRALVKAEAAAGLIMRDEPIPKIGIDDVLIRINKTAICGTDVHIWNWDEWAQETIPVPMVVGHEYVGEVVEVGSHVRRLKVGERINAGQTIALMGSTGKSTGPHVHFEILLAGKPINPYKFVKK